MKQRTLVVTLVVVFALVAAGASGIGFLLLSRDSDSGTLGGGASKSAEPTVSGPDNRTLDDFYGQKIVWTKCGSDDCGTIDVPIDYQKPGEGSIRLALERANATGKRIGSLVINPGGPGAPGTDTAKEASLYFGDALRSSYDIVGFDPRGTGDSAPVDCLTDQALDAWVAADPDPDTPEEVKQAKENSTQFWAGCKARSGTVAAHVSTVEAARDMDVLRSALGEDKLDYFGFSYGTRLGATYAELFPDKVGRMALDGAVDPSISSRDGALSQAKGFETALRSYLQNCVDGGDCFLGDTVDAGLAKIKSVIDEIDAKPLPTNDPGGRELTVGLAFYGLILPLYSQDNWTYLDQGLQGAIDGDGSMLLFLSDFYGSRENGKYTDNSLEAINVINCLDDPWSVTPDQVPANYPDFEKASPTFGDVFAWGLTACNGIPFASTDEPDLKIDGSGAPPILVLGTTRDPATPYAEAVAMAEQLQSGVLISRNGDGHTAYNKGNTCVDDAVNGFFIDGTVPKDGLSC